MVRVAADRIDRAAEWPGDDSNRSLPRPASARGEVTADGASLDNRERMGSAQDAQVVPGTALVDPGCARPTFKEVRK